VVFDDKGGEERNYKDTLEKRNKKGRFDKKGIN